MGLQRGTPEPACRRSRRQPRWRAACGQYAPGQELPGLLEQDRADLVRCAERRARPGRWGRLCLPGALPTPAPLGASFGAGPDRTAAASVAGEALPAVASPSTARGRGGGWALAAATPLLALPRRRGRPDHACPRSCRVGEAQGRPARGLHLRFAGERAGRAEGAAQLGLYPGCGRRRRELGSALGPHATAPLASLPGVARGRPALRGGCRSSCGRPAARRTWPTVPRRCRGQCCSRAAGIRQPGTPRGLQGAGAGGHRAHSGRGGPGGNRGWLLDDWPHGPRCWRLWRRRPAGRLGEV
mmetsp:Transcript_35102/g.111571  ORF Transcript_35102/g.111571 Transcript_35102/m.111571 type:complete len:299 (+) Transcript_35102:436-1332(+)